MNSQLYTAASGLIVEQRRADTIANNLANLSTTGFRSHRTFVEEFRGASQDPRFGRSRINRSVATGGSYEIPIAGVPRQTGRGLDVALADGDVLVVETANGPRYTRAGSLQVTGEGVLTDNLGRPILDSRDQRIEGLMPGVEIRGDGTVVDGDAELGELQVLRDPNRVLRPEGTNLLSAGGRDRELEPVDDPRIQPRWLESSAANALDELVRMIQSQRAFESYQKLVSLTMNDVNRRAVNDIAG